MSTVNLSTEVKAGTVGGTLLAVLSSLGEDILRTAVLTATGAAVSFLVSCLMKAIMRRWVK